jgi:hypothetical protein
VIKPVNERSTFVVTLRPESHCHDPIKALRATLKRALRLDGLRCIGIIEQLPVTVSSTVVVLVSSTV